MPRCLICNQTVRVFGYVLIGHRDPRTKEMCPGSGQRPGKQVGVSGLKNPDITFYSENGKVIVCMKRVPDGITVELSRYGRRDLLTVPTDLIEVFIESLQELNEEHNEKQNFNWSGFDEHARQRD